MEAAVCCNTGRNLGMTFQTLESWLTSGQLVAGCAIA
jgi:hypothetical protein